MSFSFSVILKKKYIFQTLTVNYIIYKTHKSTTSNLNIKIIIIVVIQYKMQAPPSLVVVSSYGLGLNETTMLELGRCCWKIKGK